MEEKMNMEEMKTEFEKLYDLILDGFEDWDYSHLDRLLELHLLINGKN